MVFNIIIFIYICEIKFSLIIYIFSNSGFILALANLYNQFRQSQTNEKLQLVARDGKYSWLINKSQGHTDSDKLQIMWAQLLQSQNICACVQDETVGELIIGCKVLL